MRKKRLKRELRALAESYEELQRAHQTLATHAEVIAVAVRSPELIPQSDLDDAIASIHELNRSVAPPSSISERPAVALV